MAHEEVREWGDPDCLERQQWPVLVDGFSFIEAVIVSAKAAPCNSSSQRKPIRDLRLQRLIALTAAERATR